MALKQSRRYYVPPLTLGLVKDLRTSDISELHLHQPTPTADSRPSRICTVCNMASQSEKVPKVGILSLGSMGAGLASVLIAHGFPVATNVQGRR